MEIDMWVVANHILSLALGFGGGWAYFQVSLTQRDYDLLPKKEDDVVYATPNRDDPPD